MHAQRTKNHYQGEPYAQSQNILRGWGSRGNLFAGVCLGGRREGSGWVSA